MTSRSLVRLTLLAALLAAFALVAGCGSDDDDNGGDTGAAATTGATDTSGDGGDTGPTIRVGLVTDIGGLDDRSFVALRHRGGVTSHVTVSLTSQGEPLPRFRVVGSTATCVVPDDA